MILSFVAQVSKAVAPPEVSCRVGGEVLHRVSHAGVVQLQAHSVLGF